MHSKTFGKNLQNLNISKCSNSEKTLQNLNIFTCSNFRWLLLSSLFQRHISIIKGEISIFILGGEKKSILSDEYFPFKNQKGILQGEITQSLYFHFVFIFVSQQISIKSWREGDLSHATISHRKYTEPRHLCPQREEEYGVRTRRLHPTGAGHHSLTEKDTLGVTGETSTVQVLDSV